MTSEPIYKVFVSSTFRDLREERAEVQKALLKLNCLPVGMELFPAADDETWEFIKQQIDDSDYYVVLVAGRFGSLAADGVGFTEKEYDYAREQEMPSIGFVHGDRAKIPSGETDSDPKLIKKLDAFITKIKERPVREFTNPYQLASEVITSFVDLKRTKRRTGFVRTDQVVEFKKYAELLERNAELERQIRGHDQQVERAYVSGGGPYHGKQLILQVNNYGKTPAMCTRYWIGFCDLDSIPVEPQYEPPVTYLGVIKPQDKGEPISNISIPTNLTNPVVYGRFEYTDIWRNVHTSSFILRLGLGSLPGDISPEYTRWD